MNAIASKKLLSHYILFQTRLSEKNTYDQRGEITDELAVAQVVQTACTFTTLDRMEKTIGLVIFAFVIRFAL